MAELLARLPLPATTGVGSLPHTDPSAAVRHVMHSYDVPFCAQLPRLDGDMIAEWVGVEPGRCGWSPDRDRREPHAWAAFLDAVSRHPPEHRVVKLQVTGPVTLCGAVASPDDPSPLLFARDVGTWLAGQVRAQVTTLRELGLECLLVVDEPAVDVAIGFDTAVLEAWAPLRNVASAWGLHVCCRPPWALLEAASPDVLNIDLVAFPLDAARWATVRRMARAGTVFAWGITPVDDEEAAAPALARLIAAIGCTEPESGCRGGKGKRMPSLLTPSCGTGAQSISRESHVVRVLREVASALSHPR